MIIEDDILKEWANPFDLELSKVIIPLSDLFIKKEKPDIYSGEESIPFNEMDHEYRTILLKEFLE